MSGNGNPGLPYTPSLVIHPAANNQAACLADGLYVPPPSIETADTDCVDLTGTGFPGDPLTVSLDLDPNPCNLLACNPTGLMGALATADTDCLQLSGCGTTGDPLTASIPFSLDAGNIVECRPDGLFVPTAGTGAISIFGHINSTVPTIFPAGVGSASLTVIHNNVVTDSGGITDVANNRFLIPVGAGGWYHLLSKIVVDVVPPFSRGTLNGYTIRHSLLSTGLLSDVNVMIEKFSHVDHGSFVSKVVYLNPGAVVLTTATFIADTGVAFPASTISQVEMTATRIGV